MQIRWQNIWAAPLNAWREIHWFLDSRITVQRTIGRIIQMETRKARYDDQGSYHFNFFVRYEFQVDGRSFLQEKRVSQNAFDRLRKDDVIPIYYMPHSYPPDSWIDPDPKILTEQERINLEPSPSTIRNRGLRATATIVKIRKKRLPHWELIDGSPYVSRREVIYGVSYEFTDSHGGKWRNTKWLNEMPGASVGSERLVYYLPDRPDNNLLVI